MNNFAMINNEGISHLTQGRFTDAIGTFLVSLRDAKFALAGIANQNAQDVQQQQQQQQNVVATSSIESSSGSCYSCGSSSLYLSPLQLNPLADFSRYGTAVEASVAIMYNMALAHHMNALFNSPADQDDRQAGLDQAVALYELAYNVHMQEEDANLSVEFTMAIVNNLGHIHRQKGDEAKADRCFNHLLSTILFLQSYNGSSTASSNDVKCQTPEVFVQSITHLILKPSAAAAA